MSYSFAQNNFDYSFILAQQSTFYSLDAIRGNPLPHPGTPRVPEGHRTRSTNESSAVTAAKLFTVSLLYSASIKGNSTENFLEEVMKPKHIHTLLSSIHSYKL